MRRPKAKLKPFSVPLAFCEYTLAKKGEFFSVIGASEIESFHSLASDTQKLTAVSIMLETASNAFLQDSGQDFVVLLKAIKNIIHKDNPYLYATKFIQHIIHTSGYDYEYQKYEYINTPLELLSYLYYNDDFEKVLDTALIQKTLVKIIVSFENKFDCQIKAKTFI